MKTIDKDETIKFIKEKYCDGCVAGQRCVACVVYDIIDDIKKMPILETDTVDIANAFAEQPSYKLDTTYDYKGEAYPTYL